MNNFDITDKYGAIMLLKGVLKETERQAKRNDYMSKSFKLVCEKITEDLNEIQADIEKEFIGTLTGLQEMIKENKDE